MTLGRRLLGGLLALFLISTGFAWSQFRAPEVVSS